MRILDKAKAIWRGWTNTDSVLALAEFLGFHPRQAIFPALASAAMFVWSLLSGAGWPVAITLAFAVLILAYVFVVARRVQGHLIGELSEVAIDKSGKDEAEKAIEDINRQIIRNNSKIANLEFHTHRLMDIAAEMMAHALLFDTLPAPPQLPENVSDNESLAKGVKIADEFSEKVLAALAYTQWSTRVQNLSLSAKPHAEYCVKQIPPELRPANIDALDLVDYFRARTQCTNLAAYVAAQKAEALGKYQHFLSLLHESQNSIRINQRI